MDEDVWLLIWVRAQLGTSTDAHQNCVSTTVPGHDFATAVHPPVTIPVIHWSTQTSRVAKRAAPVSLASAPFGGHAVNLAAITTAICAGEEAHPDPDKRYWAAIVGGVTYIIFGLTAGAAIAFISLSPPILIASVAGLALIGALSSSLVSSLGSERDREAALITFLVTASGLSFFGISGVFWGLLAGGAIYYWDHR